MTFNCGAHKFSTDKIEDWFEHQEKESHTVEGSSPCKLCGFITAFKFTGKRKGDSIPAICDKCKKDLK